MFCFSFLLVYLLYLQHNYLHLGIIQRQGIRNSIITYTGIAIGAVSLVIIQPRFLTKEEIGLTRLLFSFSSLLAYIVPMGMGSVVLKYFPYFRDRERNHHGFFGFMLIVPLIGFVFWGSLLYLFKGYRLFLLCFPIDFFPCVCGIIYDLFVFHLPDFSPIPDQ
jgi:hypothetical protein